MTKLWIYCISLSVLLVGCNALIQPDEDEDATDKATPQSIFAEDTATAAKALDIGDVEQTTALNITLSDRSTASNVQVEQMLESKLDRVALLTITVTPPYPEQLWLSPMLKTREGFDENPVVWRGEFIRDGEVVIDEFALLLNERFHKEYPLPDFDALAGLDTVPESMLIEVRPEALLFPPDTDAGTIDPDTANLDDPARRATYGALYTTTVRIAFEGEPAATADDPAAATGVEESATDGAEPAGEPAQ
jgi:hypothetical protein